MYLHWTASNASFCTWKRSMTFDAFGKHRLTISPMLAAISSVTPRTLPRIRLAIFLKTSMTELTCVPLTIATNEPLAALLVTIKPFSGMLTLLPIFVIADVILILLLKLLTVRMKVFFQLRVANRIIINTLFLKNQRTLWSSESPVEQHSSPCL
jgi:hypothetical protein